MASDKWTDARARIECRRRNWSLLEANSKGVRDPKSGRWIPVASDVLGILDGLATTSVGGVIGIQWTARGDVSKRLRKIERSGHLCWLETAGVAVVVWGFNRDVDRMREVVLLSGRVPSGEALLEGAA